MILTIKNSKSSTTFESLAVGDFFIFEDDLHMKISATDSQATPECNQSLARYFGNDDGLIVSIPNWELVEPVKLVEIIVERHN